MWQAPLHTDQCTRGSLPHKIIPLTEIDASFMATVLNVQKQGNLKVWQRSYLRSFTKGKLLQGVIYRQRNCEAKHTGETKLINFYMLYENCLAQ